MILSNNETIEINDDILHVNMLGRFSMLWKGENIVSGAKMADSQFARLMQIIIHNRETGVTRTELQELLFSDSKSEDVHHLLRTDIYNTRKKLRAAGLPESKYIVYSKGKYFWAGDIEVIEDARSFEELCRNADEEPDPDKKCDLLLEACYFYKGEFLPMQTGLMWVAAEEKRYRELFLDCVKNAAGHLKDTNRYQDLEALGRHAVAVCPLRDLEVYIIEPLVSMGRLKEAYELYDFTIDHYQSEIGMSGAQNLMDRMEQVISGANRPESILDEVQAQLEEEEDATGGYLCSYPAFRSIYRMMQRTLNRIDGQAFLMIVTADGLSDVDSFSENEYKKFSDKMKESILGSVRKSDIVCRYGKGQYLLILMSQSEENCRIVGDRIKYNLMCRNMKHSIDYNIRPIELIDEEE